MLNAFGFILRDVKMGTERKQVVVPEVSENMNGQVNPAGGKDFLKCFCRAWHLRVLLCHSGFWTM